MDCPDSAQLDCTDLKALLSGLLDDEVEPAVRHLAERHLADCASCRTLLDDAEVAHQTLVSGLAADVADTSLSVDFVGGVLARTVYANAPVARQGQVRTWLGWLVAAAALAFSGTAWLIDRPAPPGTTGNVVTNHGLDAERFTPHDDRAVPRSTTYMPDSIMDLSSDETRSADTLPLPNTFEDVPGVLLATWPVFDGHPALPVPPVTPALSNTTIDTLYAASDVMDLLARARTGSFEDVELIRQVIEYDELDARLNVAGQRLPASVAPLVTMVQSLLSRVADGPISLADVEAMQRQLQQSRLLERWLELIPETDLL